MRDFLEGFLWGFFAIGLIAAILLPIVLACFSAWWLLLYLITIPIALGFINMAAAL